MTDEVGDLRCEGGASGRGLAAWKKRKLPVRGWGNQWLSEIFRSVLVN